MSLSRRSALKSVLAGAVALGPSYVRAQPRAGGPRPPNIIYVLIDDLRFDAMGFMRRGLNTPNIDRLAREGVHFANAFVCTSLCSPSRASILTGLPLREHHIVDNNSADESQLTYFPKYLQAAGYRTSFIGKWHMGQASAAPRPGFDHWVSFLGQGEYTPETNAAPGQVNTWNVDGQRVPQRGYITDELTDYAVDWMQKHRTGPDADRPFFCYLSHKAAHAEFSPAPRHADAYRDLDLQRPATFANTEANYDGKPMWLRNQRNSWHGVDFPYHETSTSLDEFEREYHRCMLAVDDSIGRILTWVEEAGIAENTVVMFMGDNGFQFGEHGLIDKRTAYEASMRVPLIAWAPGRFAAGTKVSEIVTNLDIAPTILELAGSAAPDIMKGQSFAALGRGEKDPDWLNEMIYEYYWEFNFPQTPTTFAIRNDRWKYIQYHGVWDTDELYDLQNDPDEQRNLIDNEDALSVKVALRQRLFDRLSDSDGEHAIRFSRKFNSGAVFRNSHGRDAAPFPERWLRDEHAPDILQHFIPDGPLKPQILRGMAARREVAGH